MTDLFYAPIPHFCLGFFAVWVISSSLRLIKKSLHAVGFRAIAKNDASTAFNDSDEHEDTALWCPSNTNVSGVANVH